MGTLPRWHLAPGRVPRGRRVSLCAGAHPPLLSLQGQAEEQQQTSVHRPETEVDSGIPGESFKQVSTTARKDFPLEPLEES